MKSAITILLALVGSTAAFVPGARSLSAVPRGRVVVNDAVEGEADGIAGKEGCTRRPGF